MAQEINEEPGRVLRERGVIGDALDGVERKAKVKREQIVYGVAFVTTVALFMANILGAKMVMFITTILPMLGSMRAIYRADVLALQKWTAYWIVYALVNDFLDFLFVGVQHYFKGVYFVELLLLTWCAAPMQNNGLNIIFQKVFGLKIFKKGSVASGGNGAVGPPPPAAGGNKSPDTRRKMRK